MKKYGSVMKFLNLVWVPFLGAACSNMASNTATQSLNQGSFGNKSSTGGTSKEERSAVKFASAELNSRSAAFPKLQNSPPEYIDSMDYVGPCRTKGCSVARTGGHNLHWYVTQSEGDRGRAYYVKGEDQRCWERLDWDNGAVRITYDNCWWTPGYKYSRYADGSWLARIWKPGDAITADHTVFGGNWDSCTDTPIGSGQKRVMTFLWRVKDFDWGPAGRLDTIAIRQSYPHEPRIREHYFYARGHGLIAWNYEDDSKPGDYKFNAFNLPSSVKPIPLGTKCVQVESLNDAQPVAPAMPNQPSGQVTTPAMASQPSGQVSAPAMPASSASSPEQSSMPLPATPSQPQASAPTCALTQISGGFVFARNQPVSSCSKKYSLVFQADGNLVLYNTVAQRAIWSSMSGQSGADSAVFQADGNLVVYRAGSALWNSKTGGSAGAHLVLQDDGNLLIRLNGRVLWNSMTAGQ